MSQQDIKKDDKKGDKMANEEFEMEPPPSYLTCQYSIDNIKNKSFKAWYPGAKCIQFVHAVTK